jgi:hypothetical protein
MAKFLQLALILCHELLEFMWRPYTLGKMFFSKFSFSRKVKPPPPASSMIQAGHSDFVSHL